MPVSSAQTEPQASRSATPTQHMQTPRTARRWEVRQQAIANAEDEDILRRKGRIEKLQEMILLARQEQALEEELRALGMSLDDT